MAIGLGGVLPSCQIVGNRVGYLRPEVIDAQRQHRALLLIGPLRGRLAEEMVGFGQALVSDNAFSGRSLSHLVEFRPVVVGDRIDFAFERITFSNNICDHADAGPRAATVRFSRSHLAVVGNHVKAGKDIFAMNLGSSSKIALMGNVTTGGYDGVGTVVPLPIDQFNVRI